MNYHQKGIVMQNRFCLSLIFIITCGSFLFGQDAVAQDSTNYHKYNFSEFGHETWSFIKQPGRWDGGDWIRLGAIGAASFVLMEEADQPIRDAVHRDHRYVKSAVIEGGRMYGDVYTPVFLFTGFALTSWIADDHGTWKVAYEIAQSTLYAGGANFIVKTVVGRARPYDEEGAKKFTPFKGILVNTAHQSFPGGHTVVAFALSTVFSRNVDPVWLKGLAYVPAAVTFVARVYQDHHWTSDDFAGAAVGYFVATWVVDQHEQSESRLRVSSVFPLTVSIRLD